MFEKEHAEIQKLGERISNIFEIAEKGNRALTAKEAAAVAMLEDGIDKIRKELPANSPLTLQSKGGPVSSAQNTAASSIAGRGRDYRKLFGTGPTLDSGAYKTFNDFLKEVRTMSESVPSSGGFSVPDQFAAWLLDASLESEIVRPRATVWPMKSDTLKVPGWDAADHSSALFGGLKGTWIAELAASTEVYAKMRQIQLNAKKLAVFTAASNELVADGIDFDAQITAAMVKTLSWYLDYYFLQGNGAGCPLGVLSDPALLVITKETGQATNTVVYENLCKMYARMAPQCIGNSVWIISQTCVPSLLQLSLSVGTGGSAIQPAALQSNGQFSLLGRPVIFTEKVPALSSQGDVSLIDFSQYAIGMRKEISLDRSIHPGWTVDTQSYRAICRVDGQGTWDTFITPKAGDTLSWCVTLGAR